MTKSLLLGVLWTATLLAGGAARAQAPAERTPAHSDAGPEGFERRYLDPAELRSDQVLLHDWPALADLVRWSSSLEDALSEADATVSADLLGEFRSRVDSLAAGSLPPFLGGTEADSARAALAAIGGILERAEASLEALPSPAAVTGDTLLNESGRRRTLVTGRTAVTVPAGVRVGEADTLPGAELAPEGDNFLDMIALALGELDRLVHLTRSAGRQPPRETPPGSAPAPPEGTGRGRQGR